MLSLKIGGRWEPQDFIEVLQSIESVYYKLSAPDGRRYWRESYFLDEYYLGERAAISGLPFLNALDLVNQRLLERARYDARRDERIVVRRIEYSSPGGMDMMGIEKAFEVIANSIGRLKVYWDEAHLRREHDAQATIETQRKRIEIEKEQESLQSLKIKNARDMLELLEKFPDRHDALVPLLVRDQDALSSRIADGKLISARAIEPEGRGRD